MLSRLHKTMQNREKNKGGDFDLPTPSRLVKILKGLTLAGVSCWILGAVAEDLAVGWAKKALGAALVVVTGLFAVLPWPSDFVQNQRLERIGGLRAAAANHRWLATNTQFEGPFSEMAKTAFRRHHLETSVTLEATANQLEAGRVVDSYLPVETWMKHVVVYPKELTLPDRLEFGEEEAGNAGTSDR